MPNIVCLFPFPTLQFETYSSELSRYCNFRLQEALSSLLSVANQLAVGNLTETSVPTFTQMTLVALERTVLEGIRLNTIVETDNEDPLDATPTSTLPFVSTVQYVPDNLLREEAYKDINLANVPYYARAIQDVDATEIAALTTPQDFSRVLNVPSLHVPSSLLVVPVFRSNKQNDQDTGDTSGYLDGVLLWNTLLANNLPDSVGDIAVELSDNCGGGTHYKFLVQGQNSSYVGPGSYHLTDFPESGLFKTKYEATLDFGSTLERTAVTLDVCLPTLTMYATENFRDQYRTGESMVYTALVLVVFLITTMIFSCYICVVRRRRNHLETTVENTVKIVTNVFPGVAGKRILTEAQEYKSHNSFGAKAELKKLLGSSQASPTGSSSPVTNTEGKPIADFFPSCTIGTLARLSLAFFFFFLSHHCVC